MNYGYVCFFIERAFSQQFTFDLIMTSFFFPLFGHQTALKLIVLAYVFSSVLTLQRDCGRPPVPRKDPETKPEDESLLSDHPYVEKVLFL